MPWCYGHAQSDITDAAAALRLRPVLMTTAAMVLGIMPLVLATGAGAVSRNNIGLVVAVLAPLFARLVQMAVNRQREFLADATSVEMTRNPYGLERALAKLAVDPEPLEVANRATQHLYVVNPVKKLDHSARGLFSTHPAIEDRINRLRRMTGQPEIDEDGLRQLAGADPAG